MKTTLLTVKERRIQQRTGSFTKLTHKRVAKQQHINGFLFAPIQKVINDGSVNRARAITKLVDHLSADTGRSNKLTLLWVIASLRKRGRKEPHSMKRTENGRSLRRKFGANENRMG